MTTLAAYLASTGISDTVAAVGTSCKAFVGTTSVSDAVMGAYLKSAVAWCDGKIQGLDFTDGDDVSTNPPADAVLAVFAWVRAACEYDSRGGGAGAKRIKTGPNREEEYHDGQLTQGAAAGLAAWQYLEQYCDPLMRCSGGS